ncbi:hypothetical protein [Thermospira aquatica]|uniref:Uncharacterized protein n=1 Tax=Thermospira aquatica TaxID=2828656 RepID=A0AAX3BEH7_9SPIR|nr:hypothetical protein [Thermospira aquatica]URA09133.1 hypothetical protein KDW03_06385 [Thermospira aquatica]URA10635.1 hypothetical protein KDW03_02180 [Thermospira aquatica]
MSLGLYTTKVCFYIDLERDEKETTKRIKNLRLQKENEEYSWNYGKISMVLVL